MKLSPKQRDLLDYIRRSGAVGQRAITTAFGTWPGPSARVLIRRGLIEVERIDRGPFTSYNRYSITDLGREALGYIRATGEIREHLNGIYEALGQTTDPKIRRALVEDRARLQAELDRALARLDAGQ